jgi:cobalt-zinc-cadmium efflux system outer membrane protein
MTEAIARSPALAFMAHRARALVYAGRAEGSLPSAELSLEAWNLPLARPYAVGEANMYMVNLRQRFPAARSLDARARAVAEEAAAVIGELAAEERLVAERAAVAFAEYQTACAAQRLAERQLELLERMGLAVRARYTTGGTSLADGARVEVEQSKVRRSLARLHGEIAAARATLNAVLRQPAGTPLGEPGEEAPETVRLSLEELARRAREQRGATLSAEARFRAAQARREATEAEAAIPELMVGAGYWQDPGMRPGLGLSLGMTLPWLWGPQRHRLDQAREEESSERAGRAAAELDAQLDIGASHARLVALEAQLREVSTQALPAARRSLDALAAAYSTGNTSLLEWIDAARSVLEFELEVIELRGDLARGVAGLERAVGVALVRTPIDQDSRP